MKKLLLIPLLILAPAFSYADVYECKNGSDKVIFQKYPCANVDNAKPLDLKQPSPELLLRIQEEAKLRALDDKKRKIISDRRDFEEAKRQAEIREINARENAWNELNYNIQKSREEFERRQAKWECEHRRVINASDGPC